jgi:hypothetical protein
MKYIGAIVLISIVCVFIGCNTVHQSHILSQLTTIREVQSHAQELDAVGSFERAELKNTRELLRATFLSLRLGFGRDRNGEFALEEFDEASLRKAFAGRGFLFLFENPKEYVLISNLFVPHVGDFGPTEFLQQTEGCYVLHITKTPRLTSEVETKMATLNSLASADDGRGTASNSDLESLVRQGIFAEASSYDGSRVDIIEFVQSGRRTTRYIINPFRPLDTQGHYRDEYSKTVDELFLVIWKYFM